MPKRQLLRVDILDETRMPALKKKRKLNEDHQYEESLFLQ